MAVIIFCWVSGVSLVGRAMLGEFSWVFVCVGIDWGVFLVCFGVGL